jgi:hypothetical protein
MHTTGPTVIHLVVAGSKVHAEAISAERRRSLEVRHINDDCHHPTIFGHDSSICLVH